jgi:hypothetical protein
MAAAKMGGIDVDLNDAGLVRIKLPPSKIAAQQE